MKKIVFFILLIISLIGCYRDIELISDKNYKPQLIVNSIFMPDSTIKIEISKSALPGQLDSSYLKIKVDSLKLYAIRNNQKVLLDKKVDFYSPYKLNYKVKDDENYFVEVWALDKYVSAFVEIPDRVPINDVNLQLTDVYIDTMGMYMNVSFQAEFSFDDPDTPNFYLAYFYYYANQYLFLEDTIVFDKESANFYFNDVIDIHSGYWADYGRTFSGLVFSDEHFNGSTFLGKGGLTVSFFLGDFSNLNSLDTIVIYFQLFTFSKDLFKYFETYNKYSASEYNPFIEPINVYSNVKNGLGLVGGVNYCLDSVVIPLKNWLQK